MNTRKLGVDGPEVSCIGLGGMPLSISGRPDETSAIQVVHAAVDAGMTLIDTADVYCLDDGDIGHNERLVAKALRQCRNASRQIVVATKGGLERPGGNWTSNAHPDHLRAACDESLTALGVECIDLYQLHAPDPQVSLEDSVGTLADLKQAGKIRAIGLSNVDLEQIERARGVVEIASVQNSFNILDARPADLALLRHCEGAGIAFLPYSPVGGHRGHVRVRQSAPLVQMATHHAATPYQICLAWLLALSPVTIPIPGASRTESARSSAQAADIHLSAAEMTQLDRALRVETD